MPTIEYRTGKRREDIAMPDNPRKTITITGCSVAHQGTGKNNKPYTIYKITANNDQGADIADQLNTFEELPVGETIEVEVTGRKESEQYGTTYTIKRVKGTGSTVATPTMGQPSGSQVSGALEARMTSLETRMTAVEKRLKDDIPF